MYEIIKHTAKKSTVIFTSPCETMAKARFAKSSKLLKLNESLELKHNTTVVDSAKKELVKDEDGEFIFPEASGHVRDLCNISGVLPAQFRTSPVDTGIGWGEHVMEESTKRFNTPFKAAGIKVGDEIVLKNLEGHWSRLVTRLREKIPYRRQSLQSHRSRPFRQSYTFPHYR